MRKIKLSSQEKETEKDLLAGIYTPVKVPNFNLSLRQ